MSFFFRKNKGNSIKPQFTGLQVQTSSSAIPVTILFGTNSIAPNVFWYDNFQTVTRKEKQGGKGGSVTTTSYDYTADVMLGLCEGPISAVLTSWADREETTIAEEGFTLFTGKNPQGVWSHLKANFPDKAIPYNGLAYVAANDYALSDSASIRNHNFEVSGRLSGTLTGIVNQYDADVALCIQQFLTDPMFGAHFPKAFIHESTLLGSSNSGAYQTYCQAMGFGISPALSSSEKAHEVLERWLMLTNSTVVWSDNVLKFIPFTEESVTGNGVTWVANTAPLYSLNDDDYLETGGDPIKIKRINVSETNNIVRLEISDRENRYAKLPVESRDDSAIQLYGERVGDTILANEFCTQEMGRLSGQLKMQRDLYVRNEYMFGLSWEYILLEPMDVVNLTDSKLGLNQKSVRIVEIQEDDYGELSVIAEDMIAGLGQPVSYPTQPVVNNPVNQGEIAPNVNPPMIYQPDLSLTGGVTEIWVAASGAGGSAIWGGAQVWVSTDNTTYTQIGTITERATQGVLTAALPDYTGTSPDTVNTLSVDLSMSAGTLLSTQADDADAGVTAALIDNEVLSHTTANLTGTNTYDLSRLYRSQYSTLSSAHNSGASYARIDEAVEKIQLPEAFVGQQLYVKFVSFNVWGLGLQDISTVTPYTYTPSEQTIVYDGGDANGN